MHSMPHSRYGPIVRLGNWYEDNCLEEEKLQNFQDKQRRGELLMDKVRRLYKDFHKEINFAAPTDNVSFGDIVQLMPVGFRICGKKDHYALSININQSVIRHSQSINEDCELTIAPIAKSCVRNSFRIISADDRQRENELLKYGQSFRLASVAENDKPALLLYSSQKSGDLTVMIRSSYDSRKLGEINLPLGLCGQKDCGPGKLIPAAYTNWFCQNIDPHKRFETEGTPLPSNEPLVITHKATNRNLAAENVPIQTLFGPEYLVSVQNYKNVFKRETWQNIWMISNDQQFKK